MRSNIPQSNGRSQRVTLAINPPRGGGRTRHFPCASGWILVGTDLCLLWVFVLVVGCRLLDEMRDLRPVVETGYENILLTRLLIEEVWVFCATS